MINLPLSNISRFLLLFASITFGQELFAQRDDETHEYGSNPSISELLTYAKTAISNNTELRNYLEKCVSDRGIVKFAEIKPYEAGNLIVVSIHNTTNIIITGLIVRSDDKAMEALELDGRAIIEFEPIAPGDTGVYSEKISNMRELFPELTVTSIVALDVFDERGVQIIDDLFMARWPEIKSEEDMRFALSVFCK